MDISMESLFSSDLKVLLFLFNFMYSITHFCPIDLLNLTVVMPYWLYVSRWTAEDKFEVVSAWFLSVFSSWLISFQSFFLVYEAIYTKFQKANSVN